jgi:basic amino acid/polyamine antiporter, APA family
VIFFAYIGFDAVSTAAQEAKNPQKDMPIGILVSLGIATLLYILVALVMTGIISYKELNVDAPMATAIDAVGPGLKWLTPYIKLGAIAGLSSVILVMMLGQSRIFYTMSRDGLMPDAFSALHPKFQTPHISTMVTGIASVIMAGLFPVSILGELVSIGTLLAFFIVCVGVMVLRYKKPDIHRPFKTPLMPLIPILGAGIALLQMVFLPEDTWLRLVIWMALGLAIYFLYGRKHSRITE